MPAQITATFRARLFRYLDLAAETRRLAQTSKRRSWRIIDARHFIAEAAELGAAAGHSGWRLP